MVPNMQFTGATNTPAWSNISAQFSNEFGIFAHIVLSSGPRTLFSISAPDPLNISITNDNRLLVDLPGVEPQLFDISTDNMLHRLGIYSRNGRELVVSLDCREGQTRTLPSSIGSLSVGPEINAVVHGPATVSGN